jgi:hypothetical protein
MLLIGLGWDVGGWQGKKQGFAVAVWDGMNIEWKNSPYVTSLDQLGNDPIVALWNLWARFMGTEELGPDDKVVIGIDAPLGWPMDFQALIHNTSKFPEKVEKQINNRFAYRKTEQYIYEKYEKMPLSASFDKLGNNATVAISYAKEWANRDLYRVLPQQSNSFCRRAIIEVYPGLEKDRDPFKNDAVKNALDRLPSSLPDDTYDAAICALLALSMADQTGETKLPRLEGPADKGIDEAVLQAEGWIYHWE